MTRPGDIKFTTVADLQDGMFIGGGPRQCWEASSCGVYSLDSDSTSAERTGADTLRPTIVSLHGETSKGFLPSVAAASDAEGLGSVSDLSSDPLTNPLIEKLQRLLEMPSKGECDLQSAPTECNQMDSELHSALPPGLAWKIFSQSTAHMNAAEFRSLVSGMVCTDFTATAPPHNCVAACQYAKRTSGCRMGENCDRCHLCFWQRQSAKWGSQAQSQQLKVEPLALSPIAENQNTKSKDGLAPLGNLKLPCGCVPESNPVGWEGDCSGYTRCPECHECPWRPVQDESWCSTGLFPQLVPGYSRDALDVLEKNILMEIEKSAVNVGVAGLPFFSQDEPIKVPVAEMPWPTKIAQFRSTDHTQAEVSTAIKPPSFSQDNLPEDVPSLGSMGHPFSCKPACKYSGKRSGCKDGAKCDRCHFCRWSPKVNIRLRNQLPNQSKTQFV